jgi:hypothetical protein
VPVLSLVKSVLKSSIIKKSGHNKFAYVASSMQGSGIHTILILAMGENPQNGTIEKERTENSLK